MNYHIGTMLIDENFTDGCDCPICKIKKTVNERLTEQYLGEAVMEEDTRMEVNKLGFCPSHYSLLFSFRSKLGLALQISTRLLTMRQQINFPKNARQAKKQGETLLKMNETCVICKYLEEHMIRYYKTVAEVYNNVASFKDRLLAVDGFCMEHYANLLKYAGYAGSKQNEYVADLYAVQSKKVDKLKIAIDEFCIHHDYRRVGTPLSDEARDSLKVAQKTLYGDNK